MESELLLSVAERMFREKILTQKGLDMLYSIRFDTYHETVYYSIAIRLTEIYGEYVDQKGLDKSEYQRLRKSSVDTYIRFYTLKKQLSLDEVRECHAATKESFNWTMI